MALWKQKIATVLLVSGERLTVVQGHEARVEFFNSAEVNWSHEQKAREDLAKLIPSARRKQIRDLCLVLPRLMFFSKQVRLPSVDADELRKMAALQISQHLPYPAEQAAWDIVIGQPRGSSTEVLILAIQLESVMKYLRSLSVAGLAPTHVTISSNAAAALLGSLDMTSQKVLFLPEDNYSEFCFCTSDNNFCSSRGIVYGEKDFGTEKVKDFFIQVRLTFEAHRKNFPQNTVAAGYYLKGFIQGVPQDFWETLNQESGILWKELPVDNLLKIFAAVRAPGKPTITADMLVGLAFLRRGFNRICNFLPREYKARNTVRALRQNMAAISFSVLGVILSMTLAVSAPVIKKWDYARRLDNELKLVENPFLKLRKERALWSAMTRGLEARVSPLRFVEELYRSAPQGIAFSRIQVRAFNELELEGQAFQSSTVNDLQEKLIASSLFRDVRLERTIRRPGPMGEVVQFTISAKLQNTQTTKDSP